MSLQVEVYPPFRLVCGCYGDREYCLLIGWRARRGWSHSVAQQQMRGWSSSSHSRGQRAKVIMQFERRVSLLPERNAIGQSQAEAVGVQWLRFLGFPGRHGNMPSLQLCHHLPWAEEDHRVSAATVNQLHQTLLIVQLAISSVLRCGRPSAGLLSPAAVVSQLHQTHSCQTGVR